MVSVIIPAYNAGQCIGRAIESVLGQSYSDYEIILVDDGSTDETGEVVKRYGDKVRYIYQENAGVSAARNTGISAAKGQWIAFLDADDEWLGNKLRLQIKLMTEHSDLQWCGTNRYQSDVKRKRAVGNAKAINKALAPHGYFDNYFNASKQGLCPVITSTMMVRQNIFAEIGVFEVGRTSGEDMDLWWRIAHHYPKIGYLAEPLVVVHLDLDNAAFTKRRLDAKRGGNMQELVARHLRLAEQVGDMEVFVPYASKWVRSSLITMIYHGFKSETRLTVRMFSHILPWCWRVMAYVLTVFPRLTSVILQSIAYLGYRMGFERDVNRRWINQRSLPQDSE